jgi:hypothetical protein
LTFGGIPNTRRLLHLLLGLHHFELLDDQDGSPVPDVTHQCNSLFQHGPLVAQEVIKVY